MRKAAAAAESHPDRPEVSEVSEVSEQTVDAIETGRLHPSLPLAFMLAAVFRSRIEDLFTPAPNTGPAS